MDEKIKKLGEAFNNLGTRIATAMAAAYTSFFSGYLREQIKRAADADEQKARREKLGRG